MTPETLAGHAVPNEGRARELASAMRRFKDRDIEGCQAVLAAARSADAELPPPGVMMAKLWLNVDQIGTARAQLEETIVKHPDDPDAYLMLGDLDFRDRQVTAAGLLFEKAAALTATFDESAARKRDFQIRCNAGNAAVAEARKQWEKARDHLEAWRELDPDNAAAHQRRGIVLFQLGEEAESLAAFRTAKKIDPKAVQPELAMARLHDDSRRKDVARKLIEEAIAAAPQDASVLVAAAMWYLGQNDLDRSKALADKALVIDPANLDGRIVRGQVARIARDYRTATRFFDEARARSPDSFPATNSLALVLVESNALADRQRALDLANANLTKHPATSPQHVNALTTLAWVQYKLGRRAEAERLLEQVSRNNALTTDGAYYVSRILVDRGERDRARQILEEVLATEPMFATRPDAVDLLNRIRPAAGR